MDKEYYLAIDIGASSGRHMLAWLENGKIVLKEIYRFANSFSEKNGHLIWDIEQLFNEILNGMTKCSELNIKPVSMGIDTWAVDYVLLDSNDQRIGECYAYRDPRTDKSVQRVYGCISEDKLYRRTGIQKQKFNTVFQLVSDQIEHPEYIERAESFLMLPDYFNFLLTGEKCQEFTNATTTQLINSHSMNWDFEIIKALKLPEKLFHTLSFPGTKVGALKKEIAEKVGFCCDVILPPTHDTASAIMSMPTSEKDVLYLSSGTWSLLGCEAEQPYVTEQAFQNNFTNEGGYGKRICFLKNIMGLWIIQYIQKEFQKHADPKDAEKYSFANICKMAEQETISSLIDVNSERYLAPESMIEAICTEIKEKGEKVPVTPGQIARVVYRSLAFCYRDAIHAIESCTGRTYSSICIIGGGSKADYLNRLTMEICNKTVYAGPTEATAIGNLGTQMISRGVVADLDSLREIIKQSFPIRCYCKS